MHEIWTLPKMIKNLRTRRTSVSLIEPVVPQYRPNLKEEPRIEISENTRKLAQLVVQKGRGNLDGHLPGWFSLSDEPNQFTTGGVFLLGQREENLLNIQKIITSSFLNPESGLVPSEAHEYISIKRPVWVVDDLNDLKRIRLTIFAAPGVTEERDLGYGDKRFMELVLRMAVPQEVYEKLKPHLARKSFPAAFVKELYPDLIAADYNDVLADPKHPKIQLITPKETPTVIVR